jgi:uncharacterized membrane protein YphA (DoxX/SURF4 family)
MEYISNLFTMSTLTWCAQILLAAVFLYAGFRMILVHRPDALPEHEPSVFCCAGLPLWLAAPVALAEIAGALCLLVPVDLWLPDILPRLTAGVLALLTVVPGIYQVRRKQSAAPVVSVFLLALFVLVAHWD